MDTEKVEQRHREIVEVYFDYLNQVYDQKAGAVEKLLDLWDDDGIFEFRSTPPVIGSFHGKNAIHVLYKIRSLVRGMPLRLEGKGSETLYEEAALVS